MLVHVPSLDVSLVFAYERCHICCPSRGNTLLTMPFRLPSPHARSYNEVWRAWPSKPPSACVDGPSLPVQKPGHLLHGPAVL